MRHSFQTVFVSIIAIVWLTGCVSSTHSLEKDASSKSLAPLTVYLVRHAEKTSDGTRDPALTQQGKQRAEALAALLAGVDLDYIHSTNYHRTRDTALPVAYNQNITELTFYAGNDLEEVADKIQSKGGKHLVVGHSNTTNEMAFHLSGKKGPIINDDEYDRLYIVTTDDGEEPALSIIHFAPGPETQ